MTNKFLHLPDLQFLKVKKG